MIDFKRTEEILNYIIPPNTTNRVYKTVFPTICLCTRCGGVKGLITSVTRKGAHTAGITVWDKELALAVALMQHGYYLREWDAIGYNVANREFIPFVCMCPDDCTAVVGKTISGIICPECKTPNLHRDGDVWVCGLCAKIIDMEGVK